MIIEPSMQATSLTKCHVREYCAFLVKVDGVFQRNRKYSI